MNIYKSALKLAIFIFVDMLLICNCTAQQIFDDSLKQFNATTSLDDFHGSEIFIYDALSIFHDKKGNTSFEEIKKHDKFFIPNKTLEVPYHPKEVYWAKLELKGRSDKDDNFLFHFSPDGWQQSWKKVEAWMVNEQDSFIYQKTGDQFSKIEKPIPSMMNLLRFRINKNEKATLYFRMQGIDSSKIENPKGIRICLIEEKKWAGFFEGYPFKGQFLFDGLPFGSNPIVNHELYIDSTEVATIDDIIKNKSDLDWKNFTQVKHEPGKVYWMKVRLNGSPYFQGEQILHISSFSGLDNFSFDFVDAYILDGRETYHHQRTGDCVPLNSRPYPFWANFIKLDINATDTIDLFIRMEGADRRFLMPFIGLYHINRASIFPNQVNHAWNDGLFFGILGFQSLFFLSLFFMEKDWIHLYFSFFAIGAFLLLGFMDSNYYRFVPFPIWRDYHIPLIYLGYFLVTSGLLKFTETYFRYPKNSIISKWILPIFLFFAGFVYLNAGLWLTRTHNSAGHVYLPQYLPLLADVVLILVILLLFAMTFLAKPQKNISKRLFLFAFSPVLLISLYALIEIILSFYNTAPTKLLLLYDMVKIGVVSMLTILALIIGYRTNRFKIDKESALQKNLSDQKRINKAISRFVPNEFLNALGKSSITEIELGDNIQKEVTVFFSDIRNYTSLSEQLSPEENFKFVNAYNGRMGPIIQKNRGFVNQYIGDGIMAIFPDSSSDALRAAIQMQEAIQSFNQKRIQEGRTVIKVGMGMHTGSLTMGITGDANRLDATTISDSVNSASRIEDLSKHYGASILMSEISLKKLENPDEFHLRYLGQVQVKGKKRPLRIYECFDGDLPQMFELKLATLEKFESGIKYYFDKSFASAISAFESVLHQNKTDKTAQLFLKKAESLNIQGVPDDWTGVEMMEQK